MYRLRSLVFDALFYIVTPFYLLAGIPFLWIWGRPFAKRWHQIWSYLVMQGLRYIVGLSYRIEGRGYLDAINKAPCIIASKHQSAFETIVCSLLYKDFEIVLKKELRHVPLFSTYLTYLDSIYLDRSSKIQSLKILLDRARKTIALNRSILIFPEGSRSLPGTSGEYQSGVGMLYDKLKVPIYPVALNTGVFWGRRSFFKKPGEIVIHFLPPIEVGLSRQEAMVRLIDSVEGACEDLPLDSKE